MKYVINTLLIICFVISSLISNDKINNLLSKKNPNFYEIQKTLNEYYNSDNPSVRRGWKQFKRWEYFWEKRTYPNGQFPNGIEIYKEFQNWNQKYSKNQIQNTKKWISLGPNQAPFSTGTREQGVGRVNIVRFNPKDELDLWIGAATGGVWRSKNGGNTWINYTATNFLSLGISDIAIAPSNPNVIYITTGDADGTIGTGANYYSVGILKSTDDGATWNPTGIAHQYNELKTYTRILVHPNNENIVLVGSKDGILKSTDGGVTWKNKYGERSIIDMEFKPNDPNVVYASTYGYSGTNLILKSTDNGETWSQVYSIPNSNRVAIDVSPHDARHLFAVASNAATNGFELFAVSPDEGITWEVTAKRSTNPNYLGWYDGSSSDNKGQGMYDLAIAVNPKNISEVYIGGVNIWKSTDMFFNATLNTHWYGYYSKPYVHADIHDLKFSPSGKRLYACHDGGISFTANGGVDWKDISFGLNITQFYRMSNADNFPSIVTAGSQDNGTSGIIDGVWTHLYSADGMETIIHPTNPNTYFVSIYYGQIYRTTNAGKSWAASIDKNLTGENGGWVTPYVIDPSRPWVMYAGYQNVWKNNNTGTRSSWTKISNFGSSSVLQSLAVAPSDTNTIYAANNSTLWGTYDGGKTWSVLYNSNSAAITYIAVDPKNPKRIWITKSGYVVGDKVYEFDGKNWKNLSGNLPNIPVNTIVYQKNSPDRLYIGTDIGVFFSDYGSGYWERFGSDLPNIIVNELELVYSNPIKLRAATYGRGIWEIDALECNLTEPKVSVIGKTEICEGDSVIIELIGEYDDFEWSNGSKDRKLVIKKTGSYSVIISSKDGCKAKSQAVQINVYEKKELNLTSSTKRFALCGNNDSLELRAPFGFEKYKWNTGETERKILVKKPGIYSVEGTTTQGCTSSAQIEIKQYDFPPVPSLSQDGNNLICSVEGVSYKWYKDGKEIPNQNSKTLNIFELGDGNYQVEVYNEGGCSSISKGMEFKVNSVSYNLANDYGIEITPNPNNGIFEITFPSNLDNSKIELHILDVNGKLYYSNDYYNTNKILISLNNIPNGTYFIKISINNKIYTTKFQKI